MAQPIGSVAGRPASGPLPAAYRTTASLSEVLVPLILVYTILLPAGLALEVGGIVLPPYRVAALVLAPFAVMRILGKRQQLGLPDLCLFAGSIWAMLAMLITSTIGDGLEAGGSFIIDTFGCYLIGRAYITDVRKLRTLLLYALPGVLIIALILAFEAFSHRLLIAPFFQQRASMEALYEVRLGLLRARAVFPHSIAAGMFMGSLLSLYFFSRLKPRARITGVIAAISAVFTGSSSAYLMLAMLTFLMGYKRFFNLVLNVKERLIYLLYGGILAYIFLEMFTGRGAVRTLINVLALNPRSAYYRLVIWDYGTASVERNPWFGIGNAPMPRAEWMTRETIDNHWLMLAVRYGLPTSILIWAGVVAAIWLCASRNKNLNDFDRTTTLGAVFALIALSIVTWTGGLWANHVAWFMLVVGTVAALANQMPRAARRAPPPRMRPVRPLQPRRPVLSDDT